ncbi:MAG: hypothetical protein DWC02_06555 [Candidatus Poseidoniales archaeon]|nr:MAG: hypothetical protein DWC02_06555 [Candidatus Poseidoniales archaeon]
MAGESKLRIALACLGIFLIVSPTTASTSSGLTYMDSTWSNNNAEDGNLVAINANNTIIASVHDDKLFLFDLSNLTQITSFEMERVSALEFSPDGRFLAINKDSTPEDDENVKMIDVESLSLMPIGAISNDLSRDISWSNDGQNLAIQSGEKNVKLYRKSDLSVTDTLSGAHNTEVTCIDYSDEDIVLTGDKLGRFLFWENAINGDSREFGEGLIDCMFAPNNEDILLLGENGNIKSTTIEGSVKNAMNIPGAVKVLFSNSGNKIHVAVVSDEFRGLVTYDYDTFTEEKRTEVFHKILDLEIVEDEYSKLNEIYVAGGAGQIAVYLKQYIPDGYGEPGADLDGDMLPDVIDNDDDGDGIIDSDDDIVGCDAPEDVLCSKYPDLSKIRSINFNIGDDFTITDTITLPTEISSNIRNLSRISTGADKALTSQEVTLFEDSICANINHEEIIEFWNDSIMLSNGELGSAEVNCFVNSGMELVQAKDYFTQISFSIEIKFSYAIGIVLPVEISLPDYFPPTKGSISWVAPSYPISFSFTGENVEKSEIPLWWNDDVLAPVTIEEKKVAEQTLIDKTLDWAYHPIAIVFYIGIIAMGVLFLIRRDNKIQFDLDETIQEDDVDYDEDESTLEDDYDDSEYDEIEDEEQYFDDETDAETEVTKRKMYSTSLEVKTLSTKKVRSSKIKQKNEVVSKRKRLDDIDVETVPVKRKSVRVDNAKEEIVVKRRKVKTAKQQGDVPIKKKVVKVIDNEIKTRKVKSAKKESIHEDGDSSGEENIEENKEENMNTDSDKKKKKRKPVRRKGKTPKLDKIDEKQLQDSLVSDFLSED